MEQQEKNLPLSTVAMIFGGLSIPLAFAVHLVSLAFVLSVLAVSFGLWGSRKYKLHLLRYTAHSIRRSKLGLKLGTIGLVCSVVMWGLWATNTLL